MNREYLYNDLLTISKIIEEFKLQIFLHAGTLLGIYRNNSIISGDSDLDFGILRTDFNNCPLFIKILESKGFTFKGFECKSFIHMLEPNFIPYVLKFWTPKAHCNVDFWIFEKADKHYFHRGWLGYFYFPLETLNILNKIEFNGISLKIPNNTDLFLESMYGKDWRTPQSLKKPEGYFNWSKEYNANF